MNSLTRIRLNSSRWSEAYIKALNGAEGEIISSMMTADGTQYLVLFNKPIDICINVPFVGRTIVDTLREHWFNWRDIEGGK